MESNCGFSGTSECKLQDSVRFVLADVHTIAVIKAKEDYNGMCEGYVNCFETINQIIRDSKIIIKGVTYNLEFFLCCDYKFTLLLLGLQVAHSNNACAWCSCNTQERKIQKILRRNEEEFY